MKNYTIGDTVTVEWLGKCYKSTIIATTIKYLNELDYQYNI